jgi:CheY-like chemotaxis protein
MNDKTWILVVDDEECVLQLMATVLRMAGHQVSTACDGYSALELCEQSLPDLVVCDIHLQPCFTGWELVRMLRLKQPDVKALFVSGLGDWNLDPDLAAFERESFLAKPFSPTALAAKVAATLTSRPAEAASL